MTFPAAFEHPACLALERTQAAVTDATTDAASFQNESDAIEFFRASALDQKNIARLKNGTQCRRCFLHSTSGIDRRAPGHSALPRA